MTDVTAALPPEVNSGIVHGGAGPLSWEEAALSYAAAALEDEANAATLTSILARVQGEWEGAAAEAATAQLEPLIAWFHELAVNGTATQAQISAAATAIAGAIELCPEPVTVQTNRDIWVALASTNFFGQNSPPMGIQDAEYIVFWLDAAFQRATSDVEAEMAAGTLQPWEPPPVPVNIGALGSSTMTAMASAATAPAMAMDVVFRRGTDASWDMILGAGAAGDAAQMAGDSRPRTSAMTNALPQKSHADSNGNPFDQADQLGNGVQQAGSMGQMSGMFSSLASAGPQAAQGVMQPATQVIQGPMQGFSSVLSPLMNSANMGAGGSGLGTNAPMVPMNFATGTGNLAAAVTRPAGFGGGGFGGGAGGLRLPGSSLSSAVSMGAQTAKPLGGSAAGGAAGAAAGSGPGYFGAPPHGGRERSGADSANKYANAHQLGTAVAERAS
ncbi:PPE domain-containing protein [Mycobacteroides abscessus]|uniref:PPE domain-containing protein n=1 Tax=Mycobacteroides abscessus TaxID=36809 RepID=UPI0009A6A3A6|nr:PPE domain-containing protein [Mycobacteroides abscessus]SKM09927.1 PPE-repeat containing protein [Mycobacteroides abscessus subsp. massiliense]